MIMLRPFTKAIFTAAVLAASVIKADGVDEFCSIPTSSLVAAQAQDTDCAFALAELKKFAIATWYTDRETQSTCTSKLQELVSTCPESSRLTVVVYGLPNKDCDAGYSEDGFNKDADDYKHFVQKLADAVGQRKALFVLEPDAVGLLTKNGCGIQHNYAENMNAALAILSANPNADIYLDVGYWTLNNPTDASAVATVVRDLAKGGRVKGITLNTSNYRSNQEISNLCGNFQTAYGDTSLHCIADTSRNYHTPTSNEWCNAAFGAIGKPPTSQTGFSNLDYFIWIKPPGESDGTCDGGDRTSDAIKGPRAGDFFKEQFIQLWNNGYFVAEQGFPKIEKDKTPVMFSTPVESSTTQPPSSTSPVEPSTTQPPSSTSPVEPSTTQPPSSTSPETTQPLESAPVPTTSAPTTQGQETSTTPTPTITQHPESAPGPNPLLIASVPTTQPPDSYVPVPTVTKQKKRCRSDLDTDNTESGTTEVVYAKKEVVTAAPVLAPAYPSSIEDKSVGYAAEEPEPQVNTATTTTHPFDGGLIPILVVGGVMAIAIMGVATRRVSQVYTRKRLERLRTPAQHFGVWQPTPSSVAII